jgi:hypothetical protein
MTPLRAAVRTTLGLLLPALLTAPLPGAAADEIVIDRAIYGQSGGSAEVAPLVRELIRADRDELYVAPFFLRVDPSIGQPKDLVILYRYMGEPHVLTIGEPGAVSHAVLVQWALSGGRDPLTPRRRGAIVDGALEIHEAYYGRGADYRLVTGRVRAQLTSRHDRFVSNDASLGEDIRILPEFLVITYSYLGRRTTLRIQPGATVAYTQLAENASSARPVDQRAATLPGWFARATPEPPRPAGDVGPGFGPAPFHEGVIAKLLRAASELDAIPAAERSADAVRALPLVQEALRLTQQTIEYAFPRPGSAPVNPPLAPADTSGRLLNAAQALQQAVRQFEMAGTQAATARIRFQAIQTIVRAQALLPFLAGTP